jgi:Type-F conjugative transfer system protein (TrbI_Ftype)
MGNESTDNDNGASGMEASPASAEGPGNPQLLQMLLIALGTIVLGVTLSICFARATHVASGKTIVMLDVKKIFSDQRTRFINAYKDADATPAVKAKMQKDMQDFISRFDTAVQMEEKDRIILYRESVVSTNNVPDITAEVEAASIVTPQVAHQAASNPAKAGNQ